MLKILIADDEPRFRDYLRQAINWKEYGFEISAVARNGAEALEMALESKPHIALLDINMPLIDGITLSEKLKEENKDISIVLITGHSEFEYARKALKLGAEDYILKPFKKEELLSTLVKLKAKLEKMKDDEENVKNDMAILKERFLNMLIGDEYSAKEEEIIKNFRRFGIEFYSEFFTVVSIEIDNMYQRWTDAGEISLWKFAVNNMLNEVVEHEGVHLTFYGPEDRIVAIINFVNKQGAVNFKIDPYVKLCKLVEEYLDFTVTVGIGKPVFAFKDIRKAYMESILALQNKSMGDCGKVFEYAMLSDRNLSTGFYRIELNDKILAAIRMNEKNEVNECLHEVEDFVKRNKLTVDFTYTIIMGLVSICLSYITEMGENISNIFGEKFSPYTDIRNNTTIESAFGWVKSICERTMEYFTGRRTNRARTITENVKEYIRRNYWNSELSAESISRNVYLDSSYIRKLFSKETNSTISDYITSIRMQKARELLGSGNIKILEVAKMIGYSDAGYFSKCYKKQFGVSPSECPNP